MRVLSLLVCVVLSSSQVARADDVAPGLADDAVEAEASSQLDALMGTLDADERRKLRGIYVAIDPSRTEVLAMPACDDDGDYVVVLSRALLELLGYVAYADASDRLRGTHLVDEYGPLLARAQWRDARPVPPPASAPAPSRDAVDSLAFAFESDALSWLVADEVAPAALGSFVCPSPTATHESGDDVWTSAEQADALVRAPSRMAHLAEADAWATRRVLERGASEVPALVLLRVLAPLEDARASAAASTYLTLHPRSEVRATAIRAVASAWRDAQALESSPRSAPMR